ncbi:MAG: aminopeptidase [Candidatus Kapabacteria bacterium]|nr:aminopeptidase [Candidatus Kapabacteria bacterium]
MTSTKLNKAINSLIKDFMGIDESEIVLVIADDLTKEIGDALYENLSSFCEDSYMILLKSNKNREILPEIIAESINTVDSIICAADIPLINSQARLKATQMGVRIGLIPNLDEESLVRCLSANHEKIAEQAEFFSTLMKKTSIIRVETKSGTNIRIPIRGREVFSSTGIMRTIGEFGFLPSGKVFVSPIDDRTTGVILIDGSIDKIGVVENPVGVEVTTGFMTKISGDGEEPKLLAKIMNKSGKNARNLAEFGIGINPKAILSGNNIEDETVEGHAHFVFGGNIGLGGNVNTDFRLSMVMTKPNVFFDDKLIIQNGKIKKPV